MELKLVKRKDFLDLDMLKKNILESKNRCKIFRKKILDISQKVNALHIGGSFSCVEILDLIFNILLKKKDYKNFILSKGHASIIHYVLLEYLGVLKKKDINNYCKPKGILGVHPDINNPGINASTGSLGHGLSIGAGMALANKDEIIYVVVSDGELQEGSTWEAIMLIPAFKLNNIIVFVDNNDFASSEKISETHSNLYPLEKKFETFGWQVAKCDGHNIKELFFAIKNKNKNKSLIVVAKTRKGYPVSFMMKNSIWHYRSPTKDEFQLAMTEIENL